MTLWIARLDALLQTAARDTIVTIQVPTAQSTFAKLTGIADGLMTIAILVLTVALVPAAWNFRKSYKRINELLDRVYGDITPIVRHTSSIADNVNYVTTSMRVDIQQVNQTVALVNRRLTKAVMAAERRLNELNALLGEVQREAEDVFVSTAATLHGVRVGASTLRDEVANGEVFDVDDESEDFDGPLDGGDSSDGIDDSTAADGGRERPRVRPRAGRSSGRGEIGGA